MKLSVSQEEGKQQIFKFLHDSNKKNNLFLLKGSAGTGKSTLISHILDNDHFIKKKIAFSATTNKAVSILQRMSIGRYESLDVIYLTIQKLLQIKRKIDKDGNTLFETNLKNEKQAKSIFNYDIIIIDEASMVSQDMMSEILKIKSRIKGKIIFLGDIAQLPPVNEVESSIFKQEIPQYELTEIMRYTGNLVGLANTFRSLVFDRTVKISLKEYKEKNIKIYKHFDKWISQYLVDLEKIVAKMEGTSNILENSPVFLVYTNRMCNIINTEIRKNLFQGVTEKYTKGEIIIFNNYYYHIPSETKYYTSQKMAVQEIEEKKYMWCDFTIKLLESIEPVFTKFLISNTITDIDMPELQRNMFAKVESLFNKLNSLELPYYNLTLNDGKSIWVLHSDSEKRFDSLVELIRTNLKKFKQFHQKKYGKNIQLKGLIDSIMTYIWEYFYVKVIDIFADICYGYCITTHKSQGSTFRNVYIDINNIITKNSNEEESYRCLYTAITRSSKKVNILSYK